MSLEQTILRNTFGCFATGVCVVTTSANGDGEKPRGITVNSFSSVSLDPPLLLWSLQNNSASYKYFAGCEKFAVNILSRNQQALSEFYARNSEEGLLPEHCHQGKYGLPLINGAIAAFECHLETTYEAGDHQILIGRIKKVYTATDEPPLLFYRGGYHSLGGKDGV